MHALRLSVVSLCRLAFALTAVEAAGPDPKCVDAKSQRHRPAKQVQRGLARRAAVVLRGAAFRDFYMHHSSRSCCEGAEAQQQRIALAHQTKVIQPLESAGLRVDVFVSTYRCSNGRNLTTSLLPQLYAPWLAALLVVDVGRSDGYPTIARGFAAVRAAELQLQQEYEVVLSLRLDQLVASPIDGPCLLQAPPLDGPSLVGDPNLDSGQMIPRGYFQYFAEHLEPCVLTTKPISGLHEARDDFPSRGGSPFSGPGPACDWVRHQGIKKLRLACNETYQEGGLQSSCRPARVVKFTVHDYWEGREPHDAGCTCDADMTADIMESDPGEIGLVRWLKHVGDRGRLPIGGCEVVFNGSTFRATSGRNPDTGRFQANVTVLRPPDLH